MLRQFVVLSALTAALAACSGFDPLQEARNNPKPALIHCNNGLELQPHFDIDLNRLRVIPAENPTGTAANTKTDKDPLRCWLAG